MKDIFRKISLAIHIRRVFKRLGVHLKPTKANYLKVLHQRMMIQNNIDPLE